MATIHTLLTVVAGESICARCLRGLTNLRLSPPRLPGISAATIDRRLARVYAPGGGALSVGEILLTRVRARSSPAAASARHATPGGQNLPRASFDIPPRKNACNFQNRVFPNGISKGGRPVLVDLD